MSIQLTCPSGHQWEVEAAEHTDTVPVCPVCGAVPQETASAASATVHANPLGSWPNLGHPNTDSATTITAEPGAILSSSTDFEVNLATAPEVAAAVRQSVPGYEILAELGRGGMGVVYKARHLHLDRIVALKMVLAGVHLSPRDLERFRREASAVAGLQHANIIQVFEVGEHDGRPYFSMEYIEGGSLSHKLRGEPMPVREAVVLTGKLALAIHFAHQRGIVHRDLKPANILLGPDGEPKITDFGLAKHVLGSRGLNTESGTVLGTPSYMAPEQALGKIREVGPAADIYALGAMLYEMQSGRPPFRSDSPLDTMLQVASEEPVPLSRLQPHLPPDLVTIVMKCLQKETSRRYASAQHLAEDLHRFLQGEPIHARPVGAMERTYKWARRRPALAGLIAVSVFTLVLAFAGVVWQWQSEAEQRSRIEAAQQETAAALVQAQHNLYCNRISLAEREWLANNVARARHLLRECRPELRGWEWHYLYRLCHSELLTLRGHDSSIVSLAFSHDGKHIASASADQTVKVWEAANGTVLFTQHGPLSRDRAASVVFAPEGRQVYFAGNQPSIQVWDAWTGREMPAIRRPGTTKFFSTALSPDRKRFAGGGLDGSVTIWELGSDKEVVLRGHSGVVQALAFAGAGKFLASAGQDGYVKIWNLANGNLVTPIFNGNSPVNSVAFSPFGFRVAAASSDSTVRIWEAINGKLITTFRGHHTPVTCVAFSPGGELVASASRDNLIMIWRPSGEELYTLRGHTARIHSLVFRRDSMLLASAGDDRVVKVWDTTTGQEARSFRARFAGSCLAWSPDGQRLATGDSHVQIWNAFTTRPLQIMGGSSELIRGLAYHPDGKILASAGLTLKLRDLASGRDLRTLGKPGPAHHRAVAFSPDGRRLVSGGDDGIVRLWETATGKELLALSGHQDFILSVAFSPDARLIASSSADRTIKLWDPATGKEVRTLHGHTARVNSIAFSPNCRLLASGGDGQGDPDHEAATADGELKVWEVASGDVRHNLWGHTGAINAVVFNPEGDRLATASEDQTVKIWDPVYGQEVLTLRGHSGPVQAAAFSPDGHFLASVGADQTVRLWNATPLP